MRFDWSDKEFVLNKQNTSRHNDFLYVYSDDILQAFQDHFYSMRRSLTADSDDP